MTTRTAAWSLGIDRSPEVLKYMKIAVNIACLSHREIDTMCQRLRKCMVGSRVSPCEVRLSGFEDLREKGTEESGFSRITTSEGLIPVANVE